MSVTKEYNILPTHRPMMEAFSSKNGHLTLNGVDLVALAHSRTRPIYVMNELEMRHNMRTYLKCLSAFYPGTSEVFYASKAFLNSSMCALVQHEGLGLDVCSLGELFVGQKAGFPTKRMILHGNNKSYEELKEAVETGVKRIVVDSVHEFSLLEKVCTETGKEAHILMRLNPCITVDTHKHVATSEAFSKFGLPIADPQTLRLFLYASQHASIRLHGIHFHVGSSLQDVQSYERAMRVVVSFMDRLEGLGATLKELDIGGGLGIEYDASKPDLSIESFLRKLCTMVLKELGDRPLPHLMLEPGRSVIGRQNCTLYTIGAIKQKEGILYAAVNGGMSDNIRPYLYQARYCAMLANKVNAPMHDVPYKIVGSCCESGDVLIEKISLPFCAPGDTLAIFSTGAYGHSMANTYNKHRIPGIVFVRDNAYDWTTREQPLEDLVQYDVLPTHLRDNGPPHLRSVQ